MGTDRQQAMTPARQLNTRLMAGQDLIVRVMETAGVTLGDVIADFTEAKVDKHPTLAASTKREKTLRLNRLTRELGHHPISGLGTLQIAEFLETLAGDAFRQ